MNGNDGDELDDSKTVVSVRTRATVRTGVSGRGSKASQNVGNKKPEYWIEQNDPRRIAAWGGGREKIEGA